MESYPKLRLKGKVRSQRDLSLLFLDLSDLADWLSQFPPDQTTLDQFEEEKHNDTI